MVIALSTNYDECLRRLVVLEVKVEGLRVLLDNQASLIKFVVTPLIVGLTALSGINLVH